MSSKIWLSISLLRLLESMLLFCELRWRDNVLCTCSYVTYLWTTWAQMHLLTCITKDYIKVTLCFPWDVMFVCCSRTRPIPPCQKFMEKQMGNTKMEEPIPTHKYSVIKAPVTSGLRADYDLAATEKCWNRGERARKYLGWSPGQNQSQQRRWSC